MHLKDTLTSPPGNWRFTQKESGFTMAAVTFGSLIGKVAQHRANMNYPVVSAGFISIQDEVEDFICRSLSREDQVSYCQSALRRGVPVHWKTIAQFFTTLVVWIGKGFSKVPQEEADRRASICVGCPYNVGMSGCGVCQETLQGLRRSVLDAQTSQDNKLRACAVCGCDNRLQVHVPLEVLRKGQPAKMEYPDWCWKKQVSTP